MPAFKTRHEFRDLSNGGAVVDVVEDHQPCRVGLEPAQDGGDLGRVVARLFLWQVENLEGRQARHTRVERGAVARADEQKRRIDRFPRPRIFDREPRLADPPETVKRDRSALGVQQRRMQFGKVLVAAGEQAAERREGKVAGLRDRSRIRFLKGVQDRRPENARDKIVGAGERLRGIEIDRVEPFEMIGLGRARSIRWRELCAAVHTVGRRDDNEVLLRAVLVEADREPRFPLRIGEAPESVPVHPLFGQPRRKLGSAPQKIVDAGGLGRRARHIADKMDDDVAVCHVLFEHGERIAAEVLKILLDLDLDIGSRQRAAQRVAIVAELVGYAGKKELDVRHSPPPASWPRRECGMSGRVRQSARHRVMCA
jgi:hypothetical protein